jgi:hypothetical protein
LFARLLIARKRHGKKSYVFFVTFFFVLIQKEPMPKASLWEKIKSQNMLPAGNAGPLPHLDQANAPAKNLVLRPEKLSMIC